MRGLVVRGDGRGRSIGVPTANLEPENEILPAPGVYAGRVRVADGSWRPAVVNRGTRPTFAGLEEALEAHLLDYHGDLYGTRLRLAFAARLREVIERALERRKLYGGSLRRLLFGPDTMLLTKKVVVNLTYQTLSCFEGDREVYFCRVSTGVKDEFTPIGEHTIWRKTYSIHMAGGTVDEGGYDTAGVSWTTLFSGEGVAIHAAFWHNQFGERRSHGCVNCAPQDAKWVFRWTNPSVSPDQSDMTTGGTHVIVKQEY